MVFVRTLRQSQSQSDQGPSDLGPDDLYQALAVSAAQALSSYNPLHPYAPMDVAAAAAALEDNLTCYLPMSDQLWLNSAVAIPRHCSRKDGYIDPTLLL